MSTSGASNGVTGGVAGIQDDPQQAAVGGVLPQGVDQQKEQTPDPKEEVLVKKLWQGYDRARKFDENFRKQVAIDRRYAAGTSDLSWAVTTNLIGAFIDILVALLYARDPDVSVKKAAQVDEEGTHDMEVFASTLQIVISHLWKKGKLKKAARKGVRSVLSNGEGWLKCNLLSEKMPQPQTEQAINDARETMERLHAQLRLIEDPQGHSPDELEALIAEKQTLIDSLDAKLEVAVAKFFAIDFIPTERMQVSLDVQCIEDYLDAGWIANEEFLEFDEAMARFPRITAEEMRSAKKYYQRPPSEMTTRDIDNVLPQGMLTAETAQAFTTSQSDAESPSFLRVVEVWNRNDKHIRTVIDGVRKWAVPPYEPPSPTSRFYPYFYFSFYEVDSSRHAQSLSWRLYKLQDEYSSTRSNFRITRERSIPGVLFNGTQLDETQAKKLSEAKAQEYTALMPADPDTPIGNLFAPKPVAAIDMRVYDPTFILNDMERMSGVQEALSAVAAGPGNPKTATEANIEQSGTNARTTSNRDNIEAMLTDLAQYTAEQALGEAGLTTQDVAKLAGKAAFWPANMSIEDIFNLVSVDIQAGTTGKPKTQTDQQAWATILPLIKQYLGEIRVALGNGDKATAQALIELVKETMKRLGDESDPDRFIPKVPPPGSPGAGAPPPQPKPQVSVSLRGEISSADAAALIAGDLPPPTAPGSPPGAPPGPGASPAPAGPGAPGGGP